MSFATKHRLLLGLAVLMMLIPTFMYAGGMLGRAPLYEGDVRREMTCVVCSGTGLQAGSDEEASCTVCRGRGVGEFIIPGNNRPLQLVGTVLDSENKPVEGVEIETSETSDPTVSITMVSNQDGQFGVKLPPGDFTLKLTSPKGTATETLKIEPNSAPIYAQGLETMHKVERTFVLTTP